MVGRNLGVFVAWEFELLGDSTVDDSSNSGAHDSRKSTTSNSSPKISEEIGDSRV